MIVFLLSIFSVAASKQCGNVGELGEERLRACYELESAARFCVNGTESFGSLVISQDRQIVRQFAELAALPGIEVPVCLNHWRRAKCADVFTLSENAGVCRNTCQKLSAARCGREFVVSGCSKPSLLATCRDTTSLDSQCSAGETTGGGSSSGSSGGFVSMARHSSGGSRLIIAVYLAVCLLLMMFGLV